MATESTSRATPTHRKKRCFRARKVDSIPLQDRVNPRTPLQGRNVLSNCFPRRLESIIVFVKLKVCCSWASSSAGRAPRSQRGGRGFESLLVHHYLNKLNILANPPKFDQVAKVANWGLRKFKTRPNFLSPIQTKITLAKQFCVALRDVCLRMSAPEVQKRIGAF